jgi:hypothetical protein
MRSIKAYFDRFPNANDVLDQSIREQTDFIRQNVDDDNMDFGDNVERSPITLNQAKDLSTVSQQMAEFEAKFIEMYKAKFLEFNDGHEEQIACPSSLTNYQRELLHKWFRTSFNVIYILSNEVCLFTNRLI